MVIITVDVMKAQLTEIITYMVLLKCYKSGWTGTLKTYN